MPLKFGTETLTSVTCARAAVTVEDRAGRRAIGWGETPISVQWGWPSALRYSERYTRLLSLCEELAACWAAFQQSGHPLEMGSAFLRQALPPLLQNVNAIHPDQEPIPWLAALICCAPFDTALHDAYGVLHNTATYGTYASPFLASDLSDLFESGSGEPSVSYVDRVDFRHRYPTEYLEPAPETMIAWHLVGGLDALDESELSGNEPDDGYPVTLVDWIKRDGLKCLKVKLRGNDADWDYTRVVRVGSIAAEHDVDWLSVDFNCTVTDPAYVIECLNSLRGNHPSIFRRILYVEQPFPYDIEKYDIDVRRVAAIKPLFMDESAHDWQHIRLGRDRGWNGVALKTCKTQTGAILSLCWAKAHGMALMVQDLTNPMLAQIPHVLLAAHVGTIMGVETNAMQFYPEASQPEAAVHPGLYVRRNGRIDLTSIEGAGFGYRLSRMSRTLPEPVVVCGEG